MRSDLNELRRSVKTAQRLAKKYYPSGITEPDENRLKIIITLILSLHIATKLMKVI